MVAMAMLLVSAGTAAGMLGSSLTSNAIVYRRPALYMTTEPQPLLAAVDHVSAGQSWARSAFPGGLRRCPAMNETFLVACEAEMKALSERPQFPDGSLGGPLQVTKIEPVPPPAETAPETLDETQSVAYETAAPHTIALPLPGEDHPAAPYDQ
jgi:hypothetical protein